MEVWGGKKSVTTFSEKGLDAKFRSAVDPLRGRHVHAVFRRAAKERGGDCTNFHDCALTRYDAGPVERSPRTKHPTANTAAKNSALRELIVNRFQSAGNESLNFDGFSRPVGSVIGFFVDADGRVEVGISSDFTEVSYLLMTRWFLRALDGSESLTEKRSENGATSNAEKF